MQRRGRKEVVRIKRVTRVRKEAEEEAEAEEVKATDPNLESASGVAKKGTFPPIARNLRWCTNSALSRGRPTHPRMDGWRPARTRRWLEALVGSSSHRSRTFLQRFAQ